VFLPGKEMLSELYDLTAGFAGPEPLSLFFPSALSSPRFSDRLTRSPGLFLRAVNEEERTMGTDGKTWRQYRFVRLFLRSLVRSRLQTTKETRRASPDAHTSSEGLGEPVRCRKNKENRPSNATTIRDEAKEGESRVFRRVSPL
jgi:hypothetical protein